nr:agmatine deiminase family protein [Bacteroides sp.]
MTTEFPAEWQIGGAVLVAWPHAETDWAPMLGDVDRCYTDLVTVLAREATVVILTPEPDRVRGLLGDVDPTKLLIVEQDTDDTWTRDYGPLTVVRDGKPVFLDFQFNGWGLKFAAANDNLASQRLKEKGVLRAEMECRRGFVFEGGSIESDGKGTLLTTSECLLSPNRNAEMSREDIEEYLKATFGARKVLWLDHGALEGDDTDSHIDTLARLAPHDTILYTGCQDAADSHHDSLTRMAEQLRTFRTEQGMPYNLIELPLPDAIYDEDGCRLPATYANYLVTPSAVFMPVYGQPMKDRMACDLVRVAYPDHKVYPIDCNALIRQHGSLHCATMQLDSATICV